MLCAAAIALPAQAARADEVNLALKKPVTASTEYSSQPAGKLTDGNKDSDKGRWGTEAAAPQWAYVDLGSKQKIAYVELTWENEGNRAERFEIYVSDDAKTWGDPVKVVEGNATAVSAVELDREVEGRYVKLVVTKVVGYPCVSCSEMEVYAKKPEGQSPDKPSTDAVNMALGMKTKASRDHHNLNGARAVDGKKKDVAQDRWMTETKPTKDDPQWLVVDLGSAKSVKHIEAMWENAENYSKAFKVYVSNDQACWDKPKENGAWGKPVYETADNKSATSRIDLETAANGRYVKLEITEVVGWGASCMEFEVWNGEPPAPEKQPADFLSEIVVNPVTPETKTLSYDLPAVPEGYEIKYNGTDYEQVIDADGTIYRPICDVTVKASFKISSKTDPSDYAFKEFDVKVPGSMTAAGANAAPVVLPELREWVGGSGSFAASTAKRVVYGGASLKAMAEDFANDYQALTGVRLQVATGTSAQAGDIFFTLGADKAKGLKDEGYLLDVTADRMTVTAEAVAGANWGGKTILQGMKSGSGSFPLGTARDYPLYKVRGIILDVGRKTFTLDWLKQMTKQMSFYKMNDFQIHLNDNLIPLEHYKNEDVFQAYSAFRLESDVKKGGNNGKNKADLTAKDVWYSKKDFKAYIEESKALGVNIIPEIDTPAHSLALTKVRPDLRHGTSGRQNDHLDIAKQYDECFKFVRGIFDEYVKGGDAAVFAGADTIHVGADEYTADGNAYRTFVNDMFKYSEDNGKKARVWGSLSTIKGDAEVKGVSEDGKHRREMNLWNPGWADLKKMYELGFDLIDCQDGVFYIVPNAGYYYDYLGDAAYTDQLNSISGVAIPAGDPQMIGGAYAVWNDMCDYLENGVSEYDIYDRIDHSLGLFAANSWGKGKLDTAGAKAAVSKLGDSPNVDFGYEVSADKNGVVAHWAMDSLKDASELGRDLVAGKNAAIEDVDGKKALKLNGGESFASVKDDALTTVGLGNDLRVKVKRTSASADPQVLFESDYGSIMAVQEGTGKVGFTRENRAYSFNYTLPVNEWVELEIKNKFEQASLYVNGALVDTLGDGETVEGKPLKATLMLPVQRIGSTENAFEGYVDDVRISTAGEFASTMELDYAVITAESVLAKQDVPGLRELLDQAYALFLNPNPDLADIDSLVAKIKALLTGEDGKPSYEVADYCRLDAYAQLQLNGDAATLLNGLFTEQSVAGLQAAWAQVREDLPKSMQPTVDAYEAAIVAALDKLELKTGGNLNFIDPSTLTATASDYQKDGSDPKNVLDGKLSTIWHSDWNITTGEHWLTLTSANPMSVEGIVYTPRQTGTNGNIQKYRVEVSTDGKDFSEVKSGDLKVAGTDPITISFDKQENVKAVKLVWVKANNGNAAAAELALLDANAAPDFESLRMLIEAAKTIKQDGSCTHDAFTKATWDAFTTKLVEAEAALESQSGDVNSTYALMGELAKSITDLRLDPKGDDPVGPDKPVDPDGPADPDSPADPDKPAKPGKPGAGLPQTGDNAVLVISGVAVVAVVALIAGVAMRRRHSR